MRLPAAVAPNKKASIIKSWMKLTFVRAFVWLCGF